MAGPPSLSSDHNAKSQSFRCDLCLPVKAL